RPPTRSWPRRSAGCADTRCWQLGARPTQPTSSRPASGRRPRRTTATPRRSTPSAWPRRDPASTRRRPGRPWPSWAWWRYPARGLSWLRRARHEPVSKPADGRSSMPGAEVVQEQQVEVGVAGVVALALHVVDAVVQGRLDGALGCARLGELTGRAGCERDLHV